MNVGGYDSSFHRPSRTVGSSTLRLLGLSQSLRFNVKTRQELLPDNASSFTGDLEHEPVSQLRRLLEESNNTVPTVEEPVKDVDVLAQQHEVVDGASISVAWTPVTSTTTYQIDVLEMLAVTGDGDTVGTQIATGSDVGHGVVDSGISSFHSNSFQLPPSYRHDILLFSATSFCCFYECVESFLFI